MPGADEGVANVQGIVSIEHNRLERRAGRFEAKVVDEVRLAIAWMLELR
jgi:mRNA-degrading endonuclease toxin of MazEF toxin-antitoxin module